MKHGVVGFALAAGCDDALRLRADAFDPRERKVGSSGVRPDFDRRLPVEQQLVVQRRNVEQLIRLAFRRGEAERVPSLLEPAIE
jgi:hypothetical protein